MPSHWGPSLSPLSHPRTHPAHPSRSRRSVEAPVRGPPLVRMSRGRPLMRGHGGALHGRCQPERWAGSGSLVGRGRQQGALKGGGAWGGHWGARRGGSGGGAEAGARGGRMSGLLRGLVREPACRGGAEGEARSAVLFWGSLTVPRAQAAGSRGCGVPGDGAWHWDVRASNTVSTPPTGGARALSSVASHPAPSPWVELGNTQRSVCCVVYGVSWATWLLFNSAPDRCVVLCVGCPGLLNSCSPVCPLGVLLCVCGVLGHLAPVHWCAWPWCPVPLLSLSLVRVPSPGPGGAWSPVCALCVVCVCCWWLCPSSSPPNFFSFRAFSFFWFFFKK